jgi:M6 family metalloprotease-like protein
MAVAFALAALLLAPLAGLSRAGTPAAVAAPGGVHMHGSTPHVHGPQSYQSSQLSPREAALASTLPQVTRTGLVLVVQGDPPHDSGLPHITRYYLHEDNGAVSELLIDRATERQLGGWLNINGKRFAVSGARLSGRRLAVRSLRLSSSSGPRDGASLTAASTGSIRFATILCRFSDSTGVTPQPKSYFQALMGSTDPPTEPTMDHYWRAQSYNQINLIGSSTSVAGWYNLPSPRSAYGPADGDVDLDKLFNDCATVADRNGYDFSGVAGVNMAFNQAIGGSAYGGSEVLALDGPQRTIGAVWIGSDTLDMQNFWAHEMGHAFGMPHSGTNYNNQWDSMSGGGDSCEVNIGAYSCVAPFTIMWHKDLPAVNNPLGSPLGTSWIPAGREYVAARTGRQQVALGYADTTAGTDMMMVKVPISSGSNYEVFYTVEARREVSYDRALPGSGVLIHRVDTRNNEPAQLVDANRNGNPNDLGSAWTVGKTFTDTTNTITIAVTAATATGYTVVLNGDTVADTTPPVARGPIQSLRATSIPSNTGVYVQLAWSATDNTGGSGVAGYELQQTRDGITYTAVSLPSPLTRSKILMLAQGGYYQYRVRARDAAGNIGSWATGPRFQVISYQDSGSFIKFTGTPTSTWTTDSNTAYFGGSVKYTGDASQKASLTFQARNIAWVTTRYSQAGRAEVWLDGVRLGTYDLYSATDAVRQVVFSRAVTPGVNHTIEVRVLGTKNASSADTLVDVDGFVLLR